MRPLIVLFLSLFFSVALAQDRVDRLPPGSEPVKVNNQTFFYNNGYFYRKGPDTYTRVEPPLGARVSRVPIGTSIVLGSLRYRLAGNGTFFLLDPKDNKYVVITPPANWQYVNRNPLAPKKKIYPRAYPPRHALHHSQGKRLSRKDRELYCEARAANLLRRTERPGQVSRIAMREYRKVYRKCLRQSRRLR
ncbi:hypothetical protein BTJ40_02100 [Microbulbifer sp. A4B17]|uniref:DUF6515 family protein n=1 Tax=Microbulbifer sp. A4B17 TaxID=359370 RepID=UPI000D52B39A|nr:DUF6515 family protein [Microbulbifer sp. A4B17]AWF79714.1 hypothetical protein BTJ40_02100 [Microbulbifer sp. A4B17]